MHYKIFIKVINENALQNFFIVNINKSVNHKKSQNFIHYILLWNIEETKKLQGDVDMYPVG